MDNWNWDSFLSGWRRGCIALIKMLEMPLDDDQIGSLLTHRMDNLAKLSFEMRELGFVLAAEATKVNVTPGIVSEVDPSTKEGEDARRKGINMFMEAAFMIGVLQGYVERGQNRHTLGDILSANMNAVELLMPIKHELRYTTIPEVLEYIVSRNLFHNPFTKEQEENIQKEWVQAFSAFQCNVWEVGNKPPRRIGQG